MKPICLLILYLTFVTIVLSSESKGQSKTVYHEFRPTESLPILTRWNIGITNSVKYYIREKIDSRNRVTELVFFDHHGIYRDFTCFEPSIIKFKYLPKAVVVNTLYADSSNMNAIECGEPYETTYFLNDSLQIIDTKYKYFLDTLTYSKEEIATFMLSKPDPVYKPQSIWYYFYSMAKYNGKHPMARVRDPNAPEEIPPYDQFYRK